jgi:hypothetical protein
MEVTASLTVVAAPFTVVAASFTTETACSAIRRDADLRGRDRRAEDRLFDPLALLERERAPLRPAALRRAEVAAERARRLAPEAFAATFRRALVRPRRDPLDREADDFFLEGITSISFLTYL